MKRPFAELWRQRSLLAALVLRDLLRKEQFRNNAQDWGGRNKQEHFLEEVSALTSAR